jgi:hypothetical protein
MLPVWWTKLPPAKATVAADATLKVAKLVLV